MNVTGNVREEARKNEKIHLFDYFGHLYYLYFLYDYCRFQSSRAMYEKV